MQHANDATCFKAVYIVCGYRPALRHGPACSAYRAQTGNRPYVPDTLYLSAADGDRIKGLMGGTDGSCYIRGFPKAVFQWPRNPEEVRQLTQQQFRWLMEGLTITPKKSVRPVEPPEICG